MSARTGVGALGVALLAVLIFLAVSSWSRQPAVATPSSQPINFPHNVHVGTYKIDCQYCHSEARRSEYAGLPSVERCMGCHKIAGAALPEVKKLAEFTYFPHKAHIRAGLKCQTCHGPVETMTTYAAQTGPRLSNDLLNLVGLKPAPPPLTMGWCVDCHRKENATTPGRQAPLDCVTC